MTGETAPPTLCRIERDGLQVPSARWANTFHGTLDQQLELAFDKLFAAWQKTANEPSMALTAGLLSGRSGLSWGWREGPHGIAGRPLMRVVGDFDLTNTLDLMLSGEVVLGVTRTRVRLIVQAEAPLRQQIVRESAAPGLIEVLLAATVRWRFPYRIEFDPVAVDEGALWSEVGPCSGALVGEAGLRPRTSGGSGWQWYARLDTEAVAVTLNLHDPVLGQTRRTLPLLPAQQLLDWSLG